MQATTSLTSVTPRITNSEHAFPLGLPHLQSRPCFANFSSIILISSFCSFSDLTFSPPQSSQDMNSYRMFNKTENCSYIPPSFPAELPSNRYIPNQNSTPGIELNPRKFTSEKNQNEQVHWHYYFIFSSQFFLFHK